MLLSEALSLLDGDYEAGCVEYYARMKPDPWQVAHDKLEAKVTAPQDVLDGAVDEFCNELKNLQAAYRLVKPKDRPQPMPWNTAFYAKDMAQSNERQAKNDRACVDCMTTKGLVPYRTENGMIPICGPCKKVRAVAPQPGLGI